MSVRAKFRVASKKPANPDNAEDGFTIELWPVTTGSEENKQFYKWTPGGNACLSTINKAAADQFEVGDEFYVDFTKAPKSES